MMRRSRGPNQHSLKRADQQIVGRPLWGIANSRTVGSVGRSSTASTRLDSPSPTASTTFTIAAPKSPRHSEILQDLEALPGILQNAAAADEPDDDSSFGGTDSPEDASTDLGKSEKSEHWADVHVDNVMTKLQNLMNMASEQLEKTGRRASIKDGGRRISIEGRRLSTQRPSQLGTFCTTRPTVAPIPEGRREAPEVAVASQSLSEFGGGERRASIESSGSVMCEMLDMVAEDLALITADLQDLDPNGVIGGLRRQLEEEAANSRAAQEEVSVLRSKLAEMEAENERIRQASKEHRSPIGVSQVRALREELDDLRVQQSELACTQQRNALAFESVCVRTGLAPRMLSNSGSCLVPCETIDEDKALQDDITDSAAEKTVEQTEKPVLSLVSEVVSLGSSVVHLPGSLTALNTSTSSCSLTPRTKAAQASSAMLCPHALAAALVSPAVASRELRPLSAASSAIVPPGSCSAPTSGAAVQEGGSLASKYKWLSSPVLNQRGLLKRYGSPHTSVQASSRNSLSSQCSRATSPPRVMQVNVSRSRGSSPCRSVASPAMPVIVSPPLDFRAPRPESPSPLEATSFFQTAASTTILPPAGSSKESFTTPQRESTKASVANRSSAATPTPPAKMSNGASRSGSVAIPQGNSVSVPSLAANNSVSVPSLAANSRGSSVAISPQLEARTAMRNSSSASSALHQSRRWKLKWVLE